MSYERSWMSELDYYRMKVGERCEERFKSGIIDEFIRGRMKKCDPKLLENPLVQSWFDDWKRLKIVELKIWKYSIRNLCKTKHDLWEIDNYLKDLHGRF